MADTQPTLFEIHTLPGMICRKPTLKNPGGRTGTLAGCRSHEEAKETPCPECLLAGQRYRGKYGKKYYAENRDERLKYAKKHRAENRNEKLKYNKRYYAENQAEILEKKREYYAENRDDLIRKVKAHRAANPDKVALWARGWTSVRRARKLTLPTDGHTPADIAEAHGTVCYLCNIKVDITLPNGSPASPHIDHVHPLSREGCPGDVLENCRWVHAKCNLSKGSKLVSELDLPFPAP